MHAIWLLPGSLVALAAVVAGWSWRALTLRAAEVQRELQAIPVLTEHTRALRVQADRTRGATEATGDYFGTRLRQ